MGWESSMQMCKRSEREQTDISRADVVEKLTERRIFLER